MSLVKSVKSVIYQPNRNGFIQAVSRQESDSDLRYSHTYVGKNAEGMRVNNPKAVQILNPYNFVGLFQFSEIALQDVGCYKFDGTKNSKTQDWGRGGNYWTGLFGATSLETFRGSGRIQMKAINKWINVLCRYTRNMNLNEFYGKKITNAKGYPKFEVTESGVIAAMHLKGPGEVKQFLKTNGLKNPTDANGTSIAKYMSLFAHYDVQTCCKRKIYVTIVDENKKGIVNKEVTIKSVFKGKFNLGEITVTHKTDDQGKLPVIIRHPGTKIKLIIDGNPVETIIQEKDKIQAYQILYLGNNRFSSSLEEHKTTSSDQKNIESNNQPNNTLKKSKGTNQEKPIEEIIFNIKLVEADTGKPLPNTTYHLKYKGKIKPHQTDNTGIGTNIKADICENIDVFFDNDGNTQQKVDSLSFSVTEALNGQTHVIKIPIHSFVLKFLDGNGKALANHSFKTVYRGITSKVRQADGQGVYRIKALVGQSITITDVSSGVSATNIVAEGENSWKVVLSKKDKPSDLDEKLTLPDEVLDDNSTPSTNSEQQGNDVESDNHVEVVKPTITEHEVITDKGPSHVVKSQQPPAESTFIIKFVDERNQPLSNISYVTESIYGPFTHTTGSDGTRGRPHESAIDVNITVFVLEDGKKVKKDSFNVVDENDKVYQYKTKKPRYKNYLFPLKVKPTADYKTGMQRFGSNRSGGRKHAGADLYAPAGTEVRSMEQGIVLRAGSFYAGTDFVTIKHNNHIIRYGELQPGTLKVKTGDYVVRGQVIGYVGKLKGISVPSNMLHLEMYSNVNDTSKLTVTGVNGGIYKRRSDLINPNSFLDKADK